MQKIKNGARGNIATWNEIRHKNGRQKVIASLCQRSLEPTRYNLVELNRLLLLMVDNTAFLQKGFKITHSLQKTVVFRRDNAVDLLQLVNVLCGSAQNGSLHTLLKSVTLRAIWRGRTLLNFGVLLFSPPLSESPSEAD